MMIKCELIRKTCKDFLDSRPLLFLLQTSSSQHNSQHKPEKRPTKHSDDTAACCVSASRLQRSQVHPLVAQSGWLKILDKAKGKWPV